MKTTTAIVRNERGSVLVMALMVLTLLTIVAFTATRTSNIEIQISGNELLHQKYFFTADAGIARGIKDLEVPFVNANKLRVRTRTQATWDFALTGILDTDGDGQGRYEEGKVWISDAVLSGVRYNVTLWNNDDSTEMDEYFIDRDALIWLRADASGPRGGGSSVQILLQGDTTGESITGYTAQAGAGAGKNYNANDLNAIANFGRQL
jgi:type IV pilus assembly protein PilX